MSTAFTDPPGSAREDPWELKLGSAVMVIGAVAFIAYAVWFLIRNFTGHFLEVGIGPEQVDVGRDQILAFSPKLYDYIRHLHIALSGFIAATGLAVALLAWFGVRRGYVWTWVSAVVVPIVGLAVAIPSHYPYGLATFGHLGLIYLATAVFVVGALIALGGLRKLRTDSS
jgi:hypothetical protein